MVARRMSILAFAWRHGNLVAHSFGSSALIKGSVKNGAKEFFLAELINERSGRNKESTEKSRK